MSDLKDIWDFRKVSSLVVFVAMVPFVLAVICLGAFHFWLFGRD